MHITALVEVLDWARPVGEHRWGSANMKSRHETTTKRCCDLEIERPCAAPPGRDEALGVQGPAVGAARSQTQDRQCRYK